jgi:2-methylcitrate dehydratase
MTEAEQLANFVVDVRPDALSNGARRQLKIRVLDSLGVAIGALDAEPIALVRAHTEALGGAPLSTLIGGGRSAPDRAAFHNGALVRYLDFMDSYVAPGETCHPSDNLAPVLAAAEYADASGEEFLVALAVAYQVHARLSDAAPVRAQGFDHTTQGAYAVAAGVARALRLDAARTANAIALSGTANVALRVTRTGALSHWKGLAYPHTAFAGTHAAFLAARGITGPPEVFEGRKGFKETIAGPFTIDWAEEDLERVRRTIIKKYDAEIHAQSAIEGALELRAQHGLRGADVERVEIEIFDVAFHIIGGGEEGDKTVVRTKEEADHSLPYMVAVALLDGAVLPEQYAPERIRRADVQDLLRRVQVRAGADHSARFPDELPATVTITLKDGRRLSIDKADYEGFHTRPMSWDAVVAKFDRLAAAHAGPELRAAIADTVARLERVPAVGELTALLARVGGKEEEQQP